MSEGGAALVWSPFASQEEAAAVARQLLEERLVACANILPHVLSIFRYDGKVQTAGEVGVLFKTEARLLDRADPRFSLLWLLVERPQALNLSVEPLRLCVECVFDPSRRLGQVTLPLQFSLLENPGVTLSLEPGQISLKLNASSIPRVALCLELT